MNYEDMVIEVSDFERVQTPDNKWIGQFKVRILDSPVGSMKPEEALPVEYDYPKLQTRLRQLEPRDLSKAQLIDLGRTLGLLLLPPGEEGSPSNLRGFLVESLRLVGQDKGLRLRLRLPLALSIVPWEFMYVDRAGGGDGMDGFLALDPRVAIVRHEVLPSPAPLPLASGPIKVLAAFASHIDFPALDLDLERTYLEQALSGQAGIELAVLPNATLDDLQPKLPETAIFHFAGHGGFTRDMGDFPGTYSGTGALALQDQLVEAEQLGINLRGNGVRLAVLGGCETGHRDGINVWSGIAPALVKAEVPAVVANQYKIPDRSAIAFSKHFYQALAGGLSIERAVSAGRIAIYNADTEGQDWGVPVLYLRAADGRLFAGASEELERQQARAAAESEVNIRAKEIAGAGEVLGAKVRDMLAGKLSVNVEISGTVYGKLTGLELDRLGGGTTKVEIDLGTVGEGGSVTGIDIDTLE